MEVEASGMPHALKLWFGVSKGKLPVTYFHSNKSFFVSVQFFEDRIHPQLLMIYRIEDSGVCLSVIVGRFTKGLL